MLTISSVTPFTVKEIPLRKVILSNLSGATAVNLFNSPNNDHPQTNGVNVQRSN